MLMTYYCIYGAGMLQLLEATLLQHTWIKWLTCYQAPKELNEMLPRKFNHLIQLCCRDAFKSCSIAGLDLTIPDVQNLILGYGGLF